MATEHEAELAGLRRLFGRPLPRESAMAFLETEARLLASKPGRRAVDTLCDALALALDPRTRAPVGEARASGLLRRELYWLAVAEPSTVEQARQGISQAEEQWKNETGNRLTWRRDRNARAAMFEKLAQQITSESVFYRGQAKRIRRPLRPRHVGKNAGQAVPMILDWFHALAGRWCFEEWAAVLNHVRRRWGRSYTARGLKQVAHRHRQRLGVEAAMGRPRMGSQKKR
jgi:hypothetical protein